MITRDVAIHLDEDQDLSISLTPGTDVWVHFSAEPLEHVMVSVTCAPRDASVSLSILRNIGSEWKILGTDTAGIGRSMLSVYDPVTSARYAAAVSTTGTAATCQIEIRRSPFNDRSVSLSSHASLLQLPLPNDPTKDGYCSTTHTIFRYQFGRPYLIALLRQVARAMRELQYGSLIPLDISQWDGEIPGTDIGTPRHHSHKGGVDLDIALLDHSATSRLRAFCTTQPAVASSKRMAAYEYLYVDQLRVASSTPVVCVPGDVKNFNAYAVTKMLGLFLSNHAVKLCFLDRELIRLVRTSTRLLVSDGEIDRQTADKLRDGNYLMSWPNHVDHTHIRFHPN